MPQEEELSLLTTLAAEQIGRLGTEHTAAATIQRGFHRSRARQDSRALLAANALQVRARSIFLSILLVGCGWERPQVEVCFC